MKSAEFSETHSQKPSSPEIPQEPREQVSDTEPGTHPRWEEPDEDEKARRHDAMADVLKMFGTDEARDNFRELLDVYREIYIQHRAADTATNIRAMYGRSGIHNEIMDALKRLSLSVTPGSEAEKILHEMADRDTTHDYIAAYLEGEQKKRGKASELQKYRQKGGDTVVV